MKIEQQCVSLELAKKLKELGVKQESLFWWTDEEKMLYQGGGEPWKITVHKGLYSQMQYISAFTVAELGEILQDRYNPLESSMQSVSVPIYIGGEYGWYVNGELTIRGDTEADARAKMLIYLLENKLM